MTPLRAPRRVLKNSIFAGKPCAHEGCDAQAVIKADGVILCNKHYQRFLCRGDWRIPDRRPTPDGLCEIVGCDRPIRSKNARKCDTHYYRDRRHSLLGDGPIKPPCLRCCGPIMGNRSRFCSDVCSRLYHYSFLEKRFRRWNTAHKKRAKTSGCDYEDVDIFAVFDCAGWVCAKCGERIDSELRWPNRLSPSLDHRIAIKAGGGHTRENCQPTHLGCNFSKAYREDIPGAARIKRLKGETGQRARRERNGSKLKNRGFDKSLRKRMDGTVEKV